MGGDVLERGVGGRLGDVLGGRRFAWRRLPGYRRAVPVRSGSGK